MRVFLVVSAAFAVCTSSLGAQEIDKKALREMLRLPKIELDLSATTDPKTRIVCIGRNGDAKAEISKLQKELEGNSNDAERYESLSDLCEEIGDDKGAAAFRAKAVDLYRKRVQGDPSNCRPLANLGLILATAEQMDEAERAVRRALELGPSDWHCWDALGTLHLYKFSATLNGGKLRWSSFTVAEVAQLAIDGKITAQTAKQAAKELTEALRCADKAVEVGPEESAAYQQRAAFRVQANGMDDALKLVQGAKIEDIGAVLPCPAEAVADLYRAAQLDPRDPTLPYMAIIYDTSLRCAKMDGGRICSPRELWKSLPDEERRDLKACIDQLEQLKQDPRPAVAGQALEALGGIYILTVGDAPKAENCLRQALDLCPPRESVWNLLLGAVTANDKTDAEIQLSEKRLKIKQSPQNYFLLAKAHARKGQWDKAEMDLLGGSTLDADDFYCNLGYAVTLLREDGDADTAAVTFDLIQRCIKQAEAKNDVSARREAAVVGAVFDAMNGQLSEAREILAVVIEAFPDDEYAKKLSKLVGK